MERPLTQLINREKPLDLVGYENAHGYQGLHIAVTDMEPKQVQQLVTDAGLKGRGGAGFPTGAKWSFVPMDNPEQQKYLICNADEMEPGTFKDRMIMEGAPHLLLEGVAIAAYAIGATKAYIFLRGEYRLSQQRLERAISQAEQAGVLGKQVFGSNYKLEIMVHTSAGRYICGEETALLNALEGKRANPRAKPPFPQVCGLFGKPTIVNNAETLCNLPGILRNGSEWFKQLSLCDDAGSKIYAVSGRVNQPGCWELPMGVTARELLEKHADGMQPGLNLKGFLPGGASTDFLLPEHLDAVMDYGTIQGLGSRLGTGGIIVLDDKHCPLGMVLNLLRFFAQESCGFCTPCRDGLPWAVHLLERLESGQGTQEDIDQLQQLGSFMWIGKTFCALAPGAVEPLRSALKYFPDEFQQHVDHKCCPYRH